MFRTKLAEKNITHTVKLHLSGLIGTDSHPDMQKIRIIVFFFENRLHLQSEVVKEFLQTHIYLRANEVLIRNSLLAFDKWRKNLSHKKM